ncbi:MAG: hypothetical protein QXR53_00170 [Candidatus Norongarragalinales archaeon]
MRGQVGAEFIILVSLLLSLSVIILANSFKEMETGMVVAAVRSASENVALRQGVSFYNVSYSVKPNAVILKPVFSGGFRDRGEWTEDIALRAKAVLAPNSQLEACSGQVEGCCADPDAADGLCFSTTRCFCVK